MISIPSMGASLATGTGDVMKLGRQFLPSRQQVIYGYTHRLLNETAMNANSFAMQVAENYFAMTAPHMHDKKAVPLRMGQGDDLADALKANGQALRRYMDGTVKTLPADLEDAWVISLPEPYHSNCERDLARRRGMLAVPMPADEGLQVASVATLLQEYGQLVVALAPAVADGRFGPEDRPHAQKIYDKGDDVIAAVIGMRRAMRHGIEGGDVSA